MANVNKSIRASLHDSDFLQINEREKMVPRSYLDHLHNVCHEHLCQDNRLAVSCDIAHPDHCLRLLLPCGRWWYHITS